eukprot:CAMPEP_0115047294 /NCGR_PEP_ID=MMETSP0216-20121206/49225_1 /TAXON_ID=223996 /ORGANISM="Protocruzia adherens, Strain Boccale" /LENGTH=91 /DNA_ID=CAMNT_0002430471 /DNA_START=318 /DNA_END=590 /DNA_ORIENTATION=+
MFTFDEVVEQTFPVAKIVILDEGLDTGVRPTLFEHFVTTQMNVIPGEVCLEVTHEIFDKVVSTVDGRVDLTKRGSGIPDGLTLYQGVEFGI